MKINTWRTVIGFSIAQTVGASLCVAAVVAQCEIMDGGAVTDGGGHVLAWNANRNGAAWFPSLTGSAAWPLPSLDPNGIAFDTSAAPASPLTSEAAGISTLFLVVNPAPAPHRFATLVEVPGASVTAVPRVTPRTYDPEDAVGLIVRVNGADSLAFPDAPHIVEVDFAAPVSGGDLRIGGASVCAGWGQAWGGRIIAAIAFDVPPDDAVRNVTRSYLARRHTVAGGFPPPGLDAVLLAMSQGLNTHTLFSTLTILK
jgi:hypothetical protein